MTAAAITRRVFMPVSSATTQRALSSASPQEGDGLLRSGERHPGGGGVGEQHVEVVVDAGPEVGAEVAGVEGEGQVGPALAGEAAVEPGGERVRWVGLVAEGERLVEVVEAPDPQAPRPVP